MRQSITENQPDSPEHTRCTHSTLLVLVASTGRQSLGGSVVDPTTFTGRRSPYRQLIFNDTLSLRGKAEMSDHTADVHYKVSTGCQESKIVHFQPLPGHVTLRWGVRGGRDGR